MYIHTHTLIHISTCAYSLTRAHNENHYLKSCRSVGNRNEDEDEDDVEINLVKALTPLKKRPCPENSFVSQNKKRRKITRYTLCTPLCLVFPPGGLRRGHTQELYYSVWGTDAGLESALSAYEYLCDACLARVSTPIFVVLFVFSPQKFVFPGQARFFRDASVFALKE